MSQGPPPPPPPTQQANFFGYGPLDIGSLPDLTIGQVVHHSSLILGCMAELGANAEQMSADGQDNSFMALLDNTMLGVLDDIPMTLGPTDENTLAQSFGTGNPTTVTEEVVARAENQFNTAANNVPGAGPIPAGSFAQMNLTGSNPVTEFTKRRNWPAKVVEELKDFLKVLDADGRIKYASPSILTLTGYSTEEIQDIFLRELIHPDDQGVFVAELNESIASGNPLRLFYRFKKKDGEYTVFETVGHAHVAATKFAPNPNNRSPFCQAVFMMARPYPTKNAGLLDSFLEHKIENERLQRRIAELRREEEAEADEAQRQWLQSQEGRSDVTRSEATGPSAGMYRGRNGDLARGDPNALNGALTRENLEGAVAGNRPDSLRDKMARYEGTSHSEQIEMLTGLRYLEGERSRGITTGNRSPTLIKGDAGIAIPVDRDPRTGEKKKKLKTSEEYVCTDCGTLDSPEWRKGPNGPKTLCNACGLRWAKKEKKRNHGSIMTQHTPNIDQAMG